MPKKLQLKVTMVVIEVKLHLFSVETKVKG